MSVCPDLVNKEKFTFYMFSHHENSILQQYTLNIIAIVIVKVFYEF